MQYLFPKETEHKKEELTQELVLKLFYNGNGKVLQQRISPKYLKYHGWYNAVVNYYQDSQSIQETIHRIAHGIDTRPAARCWDIQVL